MLQPTYVLYVHPEVGPITPISLDYRAILSAHLGYASQGRQAEVEQVITQLNQRFNGGRAEPAPDRLLFPERNASGILALLNFIGTTNRVDGIAITVPGRIPYAPGTLPGLDHEITDWATQKIEAGVASLRSERDTAREKARLAEDEVLKQQARTDKANRLLADQQRVYEQRLIALTETHRRQLDDQQRAFEQRTVGAAPSPRPHSAPSAPSSHPIPSNVPARHPPLPGSLSAGPGVSPSPLGEPPRHIAKLHERVGELEVEREDLQWKLSNAHQKVNVLERDKMRLESEIARLRAELALRANGAATDPNTADSHPAML